MGPCVEGGFQCCNDGLIWIPNWGPILGDDRIYFLIGAMFMGVSKDGEPQTRPKYTMILIIGTVPSIKTLAKSAVTKQHAKSEYSGLKTISIAYLWT